MKTLPKIFLLMSISLTFYSCPTDDPLGTIYIGSFDNIWQVEGNDSYFFGIFRNGPANTTSGVLRGEEDHPDKGSTAMINGTFDGLKLEFTIPRNDGTETVTFEGTMVPKSETDHTIIRINLKSSDGENLTLIP